jgi:hypothetical protein
VEDSVVRARAGGVPPLRKILIHAFVLFHLFAIIAWSFVPGTSLDPLHKLVRAKLSPYVVRLGLTQAWIMFAPNPPQMNARVEAEVTFADGSKAAWPFSQLPEKNFSRRLLRERFNKWSTERLWSGQTEVAVARAAARFAAGQVPRRPDNPPRRVDLIRYSCPVPPPSTRWLPRRPPDGPWERMTIFACELDDAGAVTKTIDVAPTTQPAGAAGIGNSPTTRRGVEAPDAVVPDDPKGQVQ